MKTIRLFCTILIICLLVACQSSEEPTFPYDIPKGEETQRTTYYFVRHAEKDTTDPADRDPKLTEQGLKRANYLASYFENKDLDLFYSTDYSRTIQTLIPTIHRYKADILSYDGNADTLFTKQFWTETYGKTVLVVGHSNTSPRFVNEILAKKKYESLDESNYDNFFKVEIDANLNVRDTMLTKKIPQGFSYN